MKVRLPKVLCAALLASLICANSYAKIQADGIDYTHTAKGDGTYNSTVEIGDGVNTSHAGGTYIKQGDGNTVFTNTRLHDVSISMTGGTVMSTLSANTYHANPVDGKVDMNITGGSVDTLIGGNHLCTSNKDNYIDYADIDSITINVGGNAVIGEIRGGNLVGVDVGWPSDAFMESYTQTGDISITVMDEAKVTKINGSGCDTVNGDININVKGGTVTNLYANNGGSVSGDVGVTVKNATATNLYCMLVGTAQNATTTIENGNVSMLVNTYGGTVKGDSSVTINNGSVGTVYGTCGGTIEGKSSVTLNKGTVSSGIYGTLYGGTIKGGSSITINDGSVSDVHGTYGGNVTGDVSVTINGGTVNGTATGCTMGEIDGNVSVTLNGGSVQNIYAANSGHITGDTSVYLLGGTVTGYIYGGDANLIDGTRTLYVGTEEKAYNGNAYLAYGFDQVVIAKDSTLNIDNTSTLGEIVMSEGAKLNITSANWNLFNIRTHTFTLSEDNINGALSTTIGNVTIDGPITLNFNVSKGLASGRYMLIDATNGTVDTTNWTEENVTINNVTTGTTYNRRAATATGQHTVSFNDLKWIDSILYLFVVAEDLQNTLAGNWGVFKSSQAFVSTLWGGRTNAVIIPGTADGKGGLLPSGQTIAWGTAYGQSSRIGGIGADYSIFGGAIGAERRFVTGRTLGAAFGYDWGTVSPFGLSEIDQETAHFALYGRAASWKAGQKGHVVIDWSAAAGNSTSKTDAIQGEWEQKSLQLDARASYLYQMSEKTTNSVFAGVQYFAAEDAAAGTTQVSSMQNLRTEAGVGISYKATSKTTVYGEASVYNDAMRHNPTTCANGASYSGTNPGRLGGSVSVGTMYELNERWNLHGNYSFDMADDSKEHNVNVGASYEF